jgi:hypothetical protein
MATDVCILIIYKKSFEFLLKFIWKRTVAANNNFSDIRRCGGKKYSYDHI